MHVGKRLFPYPVLNNNKLYSQYKTGDFELSYNEKINDEYFVLDELLCKLTSEYLLELISSKKAQIVCVVECAGTMFRKSYNLFPNKVDKISIPLVDLNGKYSISAYLIAASDFEYFSNEFYDDYKNYKFQIEKNDILAIDDGYVNTISFDDEDDTKKSSIFVVIKDKSITDVMQFNYDQEKIIIYLPEKQWNIYFKMKKIPNYQEIFFSIIAVPALSYSLACLQNNNESIDLLKINFKWFSSFADAYKKVNNKELDDETFFVKNDFNVNAEAQKVLNCPTIKAMDNLFIMAMGGMDDGD